MPADRIYREKRPGAHAETYPVPAMRKAVYGKSGELNTVPDGDEKRGKMDENRYLTFALAKGRLANKTLSLLEEIGLTCEEMKDKSSSGN